MRQLRSRPSPGLRPVTASNTLSAFAEGQALSGEEHLAEKAICPICNKRRAERYCPAKGEKICAVDCGTEREVTIDCPSDCPYLAASRRWEQAHPKPIPADEIPFREVTLPAGLLDTRGAAFWGLGYTVLAYAAEQRALTDADVFAAAEAMATTYRTLTSGLYYEKPPAGAVPAGLYGAFASFFAEDKKRATQDPRHTALKDSEIFHLLVFFLRFGRLRSNGRPRSRAFRDFLRAQYPAEDTITKDEPRIILP